MEAKNEKPITVDEIKALAQKILPAYVWRYYADGADDQVTTLRNQEVYRTLVIRPRILRNISSIDTSTRIFGKYYDIPIAIAPSAYQRLAGYNGEIDVAQAAFARRTNICLSSNATTSLEDVAQALPKRDGKYPKPWFQLYFVRSRDITKELIERAEQAGYEALVLTVDTTTMGNRLHERKNPLKLPADLSMANMTAIKGGGASKGRLILNAETAEEAAKIEREHSDLLIDSALTWAETIPWLRSQTNMKIILKGILTAEDALLSVEAGVDAIIVSNHGGRQLDSVPATLEALPEVSDAVNGRIPVLYDGGIKTQRKLMSDELSQSLERRTAASLLADIDSAGDKMAVDNSASALVRGPFGVFQSIGDSVSPDTIECSPDTNTDDTFTSMYPETDGFVEDIQRSDWPDQLPTDDMDIFAASLDPHFEIIEDTSIVDQVNDSSMTSFFMDDHTGAEGLIFSPGFMSRVIGTPELEAEENPDSESVTDIIPYPRETPYGRAGIPEEAEHLLRHYRQNMARRTTMQAKRKSPWEIIFLPCALETFAELCLWNEASHTRSSIFYTLLAHSALQLHISGSDSKWKEIGLKNHERAQSHLRQALQHEMFGPKQASYKELLMAILAMAMTSLHNGTRAFRIFLLDAERLIRLRGLVDQNPFKTRLLHHMYTHLRVIAESMSLCTEAITESSASENQVQELSRTFRITEEGLNIGLDPAQEKTDDIGYNDIHLEAQGRWNHTLYPVIYGIPESLMTLLSQTVSLSNEKARLENVARCNPGISEALAKHTKTLENRIWAWPSTLDPTGPVEVSSRTTDLVTQPQIRSMTLAIHQALVIYFYRRVYDMNAMILQDLVRKTLDYLEPCLSELIDEQDFATSLAWPAFVAGCEAVTPELQERALVCLGVTDERGVYFTREPARVVVPLIWEGRRRSGDWSASWQSLVVDGLG
ncbi:hypothetical protein HYE67_008060 [Fusarium culmorum]|uniref:FMN hydroxy acid dehydrogenase domain-containing protein n=1 Tax=Fusarium culmorum TaxID=5516 RepID=A0A7S8HZ54_FUSCU|nr:hypothetical protein HYE67_008060 [Fusarium culmorum]